MKRKLDKEKRGGDVEEGAVVATSASSWVVVTTQESGQRQDDVARACGDDGKWVRRGMRSTVPGGRGRGRGGRPPVCRGGIAGAGWAGNNRIFCRRLEGSEEDAVGADLERRICLLEHGHDGDVLGQPSLEEEEEGEEGAHLYAEEALLEPAGQETTGFSADEVLHEETVEQRSHLCDDDELPESPIAGYGVEEGGSDDDGSGSGSDRVYMIDKVHQGAAAPTARVLEKYEDEALEPDIKTLYMRLEALEADRESMRQALLGMRTEKAQLMLLREIAQQLAKDAAPVGTGAGSVPVLHHLPRKQAVGVADTTVREDKKTAPAGTFSKPLLFKWAIALFCSRKKKPSQSRYTFGLSSNNVGLLILLDKCPRIQKTLMRRKLMTDELISRKLAAHLCKLYLMCLFCQYRICWRG
ncbi:hypothetical protein TRIUR3_01991 [Triticum urartu]|uniref:GTD-binding domain-containing protein n=1 Tax=Triticum urartu TaxID=4572 RepID=M8A697_TRIUA|nr:hypothetical protein TRIUR3_01991 [Triticum urartu]